MNRRELLRNSFLLLGSQSGDCVNSAEVHGSLTRENGQVIVASARRLIGIPHRSGAPTFPNDVDCGRLSQWTYSKAQLILPRTATAQYLCCTHHSNLPGALVYFNGDVDGLPSVVHVGINVGYGWMISGSAIAGKVIEENWKESTYWMNRFVACAAL